MRLVWTIMNIGILQFIALTSHLLAATFMLGVIWFVQVVHYPLFAEVGWMTFANYEQQHIRLTTFVVLPPMTMELVAAAILLCKPIDAIAGICRALFPLTLVIWGLTFAIHVPQHELLSAGFDGAVHGQLVLSNWFRTLLWTGKGGLMIAAVFHLLRPTRSYAQPTSFAHNPLSA